MTVTIGIPFSQEPVPYLEQAIRSVFAQSDPHWELLLVSDSAAAPLVERVRQINDQRVRLVTHEGRAGLAVRLNEIARQAKTEFLFRMDGDDLMHPNRIAAQLRMLQSDAAVDVVGSQAFVIDESSSFRGQFINKPFPQTGSEHMGGSAFIHPTVAGRTEWFIDHPYDETMARAQDRALWLATSQTSSFARLEMPLLFYRIGSELPYSRYALASRFDRRAMRKYGPSLVGRPNTAARILISFAKQARYRAPVALRGSEKLYSRRLTAVTASVRAEAEESLRIIAAVDVPGWEPADSA